MGTKFCCFGWGTPRSRTGLLITECTQNGALLSKRGVLAGWDLALTMEPARHTSKVTRFLCCFSRLMAGCVISRYWLSKTMKMGFLESSSNLQRPSL